MANRSENPDSQRPFLQARWTNLCILTFAVPPEVLEEDVPDSLELETRDGDAFVSLVAFDFEKTKVWGIGWPGFRNFPEVNFRYYVTDGQRRGVSFLREFVPQPFVAWMAVVFSNEPYEATPMESETTRADGVLTVEHEWSYNGNKNRLVVEADDESEVPDESTDAHFFKEHQWGFGVDGNGEPLAYEVRHPVWETYPVRSLDYTIDWSGLYGSKWSILEGSEPLSFVLAKGSDIEVFGKREVETEDGQDG